MKVTSILLSLVILLAAGCDRATQPGDKPEDSLETKRREEQRLGDERRATELRELEQRAAEREIAARDAETDRERKKIADERASLEVEKQRLLAEQRRIDEKRAADERAEAVRSAEMDASEHAREEQKIEFFHDALDPYGEWIELDRYGFCWLPRAAADPRWRPYTAGYWAWTEYGWTWASSEPFGWATYHYGRWTRIKRLGWVWVPGSEWAPAWVAWRRNDNFVGWAPLPPDAHSGSGFTAAVDSYYDIGPSAYAFVTVQDFGEPTYVGRVVEPDQNITIINKTVNVTNITYRNVKNKTVVFNAGPEIDVINQSSNQQVRRLNLVRVADPKSVGASERKGDVLRLAAPEIKSAPRATVPPAKIKVREKVQEIDRGWPEDKAEDGKKIRSQTAEEARKAEREQRSGKGAEKPEPVTPKPTLSDQKPHETPQPGNAPVIPPSANTTPPVVPMPQKPAPPDGKTGSAPKPAPGIQKKRKDQTKAKPDKAEISPLQTPQKIKGNSPVTPPSMPIPKADPASDVVPPIAPAVVAPPVITPPIVALPEEPATQEAIRDTRKKHNEQKTQKGKAKTGRLTTPPTTAGELPPQPSTVPAPTSDPNATPPQTSTASPQPDKPVVPAKDDEAEEVEDKSKSEKSSQ